MRRADYDLSALSPGPDIGKGKAYFNHAVTLGLRPDGLHVQENQDHPLSLLLSLKSGVKLDRPDSDFDFRLACWPCLTCYLLFPRPTSSSWPNVFLPLHIFEAAYRDMVGRRAGERSHERDGAACGGMDRTTRAAVDLSVGCAARADPSVTAPDGATTASCAHRPVPMSRGSGARLSRAVVNLLALSRRIDATTLVASQPAVEAGSVLGASRTSTGDPLMPGVVSDRLWSPPLAPVSRSRSVREQRCSKSRASVGLANRCRAARDEDPDGAHARRSSVGPLAYFRVASINGFPSVEARPPFDRRFQIRMRPRPRRASAMMAHSCWRGSGALRESAPRAFPRRPQALDRCARRRAERVTPSATRLLAATIPSFSCAAMQVAVA